MPNAGSGPQVSPPYILNLSTLVHFKVAGLVGQIARCVFSCQRNDATKSVIDLKSACSLQNIFVCFKPLGVSVNNII